MNKIDEVKQILIGMTNIDETVDKILKIFESTPEDIAYEILCTDDEYSLEEQIAAIEEQDLIDGSLQIDFVDGVQVWKKLELEFTCNDFLIHIGKKEK
jgi:hypothetical protein